MPGLTITSRIDLDEDVMQISSPTSPGPTSVAGDGASFLSLEGSGRPGSLRGARWPGGSKRARDAERRQLLDEADGAYAGGGKGKGRARAAIKGVLKTFRRRSPPARSRGQAQAQAYALCEERASALPSTSAEDPFGDEFEMDCEDEDGDGDEEMDEVCPWEAQEGKGVEVRGGEGEEEMEVVCEPPSPSDSARSQQEREHERGNLARALGISPPRTPGRRPASASAPTTPKTSPYSLSLRSRRTPGSAESRLSRLSRLSRFSAESAMGSVRRKKRMRDARLKSWQKQTQVLGMEAAGAIAQRAGSSPNKVRFVSASRQFREQMKRSVYR